MPLPTDENPADRKRRSPVDPLQDLEHAEELLSDLEEEDPVGRLGDVREKAAKWSAARAFDALSQVACTITANLDFPSLVKEILDIALGSVAAERGIIFWGRTTDQEMVPVAARSIQGKDLEDLERISHTILSQGRLGEAVASHDAAKDPRFVDVPSIKLKQIGSVVCVPMISRGERVGVIYVDSPDVIGAFPQHAQQFLQTFASLAAVTLENARLHGEVLRENVRLRRRLVALDAFGRIVTVNPRMISTLRRAELVAQADTPVMILGESGTGKELLARSIHDASPRSLSPFVAYNCAAIPKDLMESLFFGHKKGAFTGAMRDMPGLFQQADRGVLFLDELAELDSGLQAKLLRVLEDGRVRPLGSSEEIQVDVRLITATSGDLGDLISRGLFRQELLYRLNVLELHVLPLRERTDDIPILVDHFLKKHESDRRVSFTQAAIEHLQSLPWPGNVRELENLVRRVQILSESKRVTVEQIRRLGTTSPQSPTGREGEGRQSSQVADERRAPATLRDQEREAIVEALKRAGGNKSKAARLLGVHRNSLLRRMTKLGITWSD